MADNPITRKEKYLAKLTGSYTGNVPDPITRIEKYLYDLCQKGISGLTPEEIENAVNKYLKENPVQPGATTEQAAQIEQNKKDVASLKEDISTKITKFYASSQGETHLADSDNGKIMDMMLYGKSEQKQYSGKNLLNYDAWKGLPITRGTAVFEKNSFTLTATENDCYTEPTPGQGFSDDAKIEVSEGETVTLSWESSADIDGVIYIFPNGVTDGLVYTNNNNTKTLTYTAARGVKFITFRFGVTHAGDTISYKNIQIEKGSESTAYEPYTGGIPSPNPDYPQEIKSVVNPTVKLSNEDGTQFKTVTLPYTLNAIPVSSGGNVTINGQQYIADYVDVERGKLVRCVKKLFLKQYQWSKAINKGVLRFYASTIDAVGIDGNKVIKNAFSISSHFTFITSTPDRIGTFITNADGTNANIGFAFSTDATTSSDDFNNWILNNKPFVFLPVLKEELPLTSEQTQAFKSLATYYPTTNIFINSEQLDGYTVFNYPISMQNGWNYVKQQIGDTRDYIYDMDARAQDTDLQAAEAYVNSEYAVALTELEV